MARILSVQLRNTRAAWPGNSDLPNDVEQVIKQIRFPLNFKSFTYHSLFHKINQNNGKKERVGEGVVGGKKVEEVGGMNLVS